MAEGSSEGFHPDGWPGQIWLEGRTVVHLLEEQERPTDQELYRLGFVHQKTCLSDDAS